jgi:carboxypeptidase C (cathepsin A)
MNTVLAAAFCSFVLSSSPVNTLANPADAPPGPPAAKSTPPDQARRFESSHEGVFGGTRVRYKAIVAESFATDPSGKRLASIFTTTYLRTDVPRGAIRPVAFVFNGGPGSSSVWLHMGFVGPRRVEFADAVKPKTAPPYTIVDNADSPLDVADLVLIDPPGTGFSRILPDGKPEQFYGTAQDAKAIADVMLSWVREFNRWNSPRYLISESYGTVRAAVIAKLLAGGPTQTGGMEAMTLNGVIMLGQAMDPSNSAGDDGQYLNDLPTLAATACYHKKVTGCTPEQQVARARDFVANDYVTALRAGAQLSTERRDSIVAQLAGLTGLEPQFIRDHDLRVSANDFAKHLLAAKGLEVGMYDGRYTLPLRRSGADPVADDPAMGQYVPGFVTLHNQYVRNELHVAIDEYYEPIAFRTVNSPWDWGSGPGVLKPANYARDMAIAMRRNPELRLMVGAGYYDLVTTLGAAEYTLAHAGFPESATVMRYYESGHMPYLGAEPRRALARDVRSFIVQADTTRSGE